MEELKKENICVIKDTEMTDDQKTFITSFYRNKLNGSTTLFSSTEPDRWTTRLTKIFISPSACFVKTKQENKRERLCSDRIAHRRIRSFYPIAGLGGKTYLMFLDDVIRYCLPLIFVGMKYTDYEAYTFKFTKDAEMEIDSDLRTGVLQKISKE